MPHKSVVLLAEGSSIPEWVTISTAVTAIIAVVAGPVVQLVIARWQVRGATLSANRHQWINALRDELAIFLGLIGDIRMRFGRDELDEIASLNRQLLTSGTRIELLLNPSEKDHQALIGLTRSAAESVLDENFQPFQRRVEITTAAAPILKREWERVKRLD